MGSMFNSDDEEEKRKRELQGQIAAPVETIQPTQMTPERVGGPAPVETITPTVVAPPQGELLYDSVPGNNPEGSVWDTIKEFGGDVADAGRGALAYFTDDKSDFGNQWYKEHDQKIQDYINKYKEDTAWDKITPGMDPAEVKKKEAEILAEAKKSISGDMEEDWRQRQLNRKLIGGALGGAVGALAHKKGSSISGGPKSYVADRSIGKLGTGYKGKRSRK